MPTESMLPSVEKRETAWPLPIGLGLSLLLLGAHSFISWLTGARFTLLPGRPSLAVGVFLMNGIAEEALYRRVSLSSPARGADVPTAILLGIVLHTAAHILLPIIAAAPYLVFAVPRRASRS